MIKGRGSDTMGYARILKDNNGKPSGYRECDGEVAFMPEQQSYENIFHRVKIDIDTMEILNHDFIKDKQRVYRKGILFYWFHGYKIRSKIKSVPQSPGFFCPVGKVCQRR